MSNIFKKSVQSALHLIGYHIQVYYPRPFIGFLRNYYQGRKNLIGAEVGVYKGENAVDILKYLPIKRLYLIDPYKNYPDYIETKDPAANQEELDNVRIEAFRRLSKFKDKIVWINEFSNTAYKKIPEKLDFIYIDANHSYESTKRDMKNYYTLLKKDSILAGHDIDHPLYPGVLFALTDFIKEKNLPHRVISSDWIVINMPIDIYYQEVYENL